MDYIKEAFLAEGGSVGGGSLRCPRNGKTSVFGVGVRGTK